MPRSHTTSSSSLPPPTHPLLPSGSALQREVTRLRSICDALRDRLQEEEDQVTALRRENEALRHEATLMRLYDDVVERQRNGDARPHPSFVVPETLPREAPLLYRCLPARFSVPLFFEHAEQLQIAEDDARRCLLYFFRHAMICKRRTASNKLLFAKD